MYIIKLAAQNKQFHWFMGDMGATSCDGDERKVTLVTGKSRQLGS